MSCSCFGSEAHVDVLFPSFDTKPFLVVSSADGRLSAEICVIVVCEYFSRSISISLGL